MMYWRNRHHFTQAQMPPAAFSHQFQTTRQEYPPVDTSILTQSVEQYRVLIQQGELLLDNLANQEFARTLMEHAQRGDQAAVDQLISSINGLHLSFDASYTPTGVTFNLQSPAVNQGANCCTLAIRLNWGR